MFWLFRTLALARQLTFTTTATLLAHLSTKQATMRQVRTNRRFGLVSLQPLIVITVIGVGWGLLKVESNADEASLTAAYAAGMYAAKHNLHIHDTCLSCEFRLYRRFKHRRLGTLQRLKPCPFRASRSRCVRSGQLAVCQNTSKHQQQHVLAAGACEISAAIAGNP